MGKWRIAGCPLRKEGCPGLMECDGADAIHKLGPFSRPHTTAIICAQDGIQGQEEIVKACEDEIQSRSTADVPQPAQ